MDCSTPGFSVHHYLPEFVQTHLDQEDPLEKEMATQSSIFAWEIPWTEELGGLQSMGSQRVRKVLTPWKESYDQPR